MNGKKRTMEVLEDLIDEAQTLDDLAWSDIKPGEKRVPNGVIETARVHLALLRGE